MKKKILILIACLLLVTGCTFKEDFSDKYVYTTFYPIEYATTMLYSDYGNVNSIYPNGAKSDYKISDKKKKTYSEGEIFIYSGVANEATIARDLINNNNRIKLIDATKGLKTEEDVANLWLNPSNYLMLCSNIKSSLIDYNDNVFVKDNIEKKYKILNEKVSEIDVALYDIGVSGNYKTILTTNNVFNYLTKYNINVISLDINNTNIDKAYANAKKLINSKEIQYIYYLEGDEFNSTQEKLINDSGLVKIEINDIFSLTDEERESGKNYITIMYDIIENYKKELYKKNNKK